MVLRMMADVIALKPRSISWRAPTTSPAIPAMTPKQSFDNFRMMTMLAQANISTCCSPACRPRIIFPGGPGLETVRRSARSMRWAKTYAREAGATWIDYTPVLGDAAGAMKPGLAYDGVHPTAAGYDAMATVIEPYLKAHKA
jgi:hypothetical protein